MKTIYSMTLLFLILAVTKGFSQQTSTNDEALPFQQLMEVHITTSLKLERILLDHKKDLRRAARLSNGNQEAFIYEIRSQIKQPFMLDMEEWSQLYEKSRLLTYHGKLEQLPSVL